MKKTNINILIVEDSSVDSHILRRASEELGYTVMGMPKTGEEAIAIAKKIKPDLILMDIELAGTLSGIETSSAIINKIHIPVIYTTAHADSRTLEKVKELSPYGYIIKPFDKKTLFVSIEIALKRYEFDKQIEESEKKYRRLFEESGDPIFIRNSNGAFIDFNNSMERIFGYNREELLNQTIDILAADIHGVAEFELLLEKNDSIKNFEIRLQKKDRTIITCLITGNNIKNPDGFVKGCQAVLRDITEKKQLDDKISMSEEKYRMLVEGSNDIIFTLDENWNFLTVNRAINKVLNISVDDALTKSFFDILFEVEDSIIGTKQFVREKLEQFKKDRDAQSFKALFKSSISTEPKELQVKLEYVNIKGKNEILGKASKIIEDTLMKYFISEKLRFDIDNYMLSADDVSFRITRNLEKYMDPKNVNLMRIAVREIIINAIEHGNLNITFDEKTKAIDDEKYIELLSMRQRISRNKNKKVIVEYSLNPERVVYKISDEGEGFDYKKIINDIHNVNKNYIAHGRGLKMARNLFDEISFNNKGNQVLMLKRFTGEIPGNT